MSNLLQHGELVPLDQIAPMLLERIAATALAEPAVFSEWIEHLAADNPGGNAIVLRPDATPIGDLQIDWTDECRRHRICAVAALGDVRVAGAITNANLDGGPLLFVGGDLEATRIEKGGANVVVLGSVKAAGVVLCEYNHGVLRIGGDLDCEALIVLDQDVLVQGSVRAPHLDWDEGDLRDHLVAEVFDDDDSDLPDGTIIRKRLAAALPVLKQP
ncbi:MAG: hypothetical protein U1E21_24860 [Reyranellaceae bacterium]